MCYVISVVCVLAASLIASVPHPHGPDQRQQPSGAQGNWPCGAHVDSSYFHLSEATGGHLFLLAPFEIGDSAPLMLAIDDHPQTIFRLAGSITPGSHEFHIPVDASISSLLVSISVQCLQNADILGPAGAPVTGPDVTDYSTFRAERMVVVKNPEPGTWTVRASGSGIAGVMVQARSDIAVTSVEFASGGGSDFRPIPAARIENTVRIHVRGDGTDLQASLVNGAFKTIAHLPLSPADEEGTLVSRFTPGTDGFRIVVAGRDARGLPFQRVHAPLFTAR